jgi:hypothetical protein
MLLALLMVMHQEQKKSRENLVRVLETEAPDIAYKLYHAFKDPSSITIWLWQTLSERDEPLAHLVQERRWNELSYEIQSKLPRPNYV